MAIKSGMAIQRTVMPGVVVGATNSTSASSIRTTPPAPMSNGRPEAPGLMPRPIARISAIMTAKVAIPVPIAGALAILSASAAARSSSESARDS